MKGNLFLVFAVFVLFFLPNPNVIRASDLDDGISKSLDDSISKDDELGQKDRNINFIKSKAKSNAAVRAKNGTDQQGGKSGDGNMNSVVLGPGGNVRGDVIIIDQSRGDKTQVVDH